MQESLTKAAPIAEWSLWPKWKANLTVLSVSLDV